MDKHYFAVPGTDLFFERVSALIRRFWPLMLRVLLQKDDFCQRSRTRMGPHKAKTPILGRALDSYEAEARIRGGSKESPPGAHS